MAHGVNILESPMHYQNKTFTVTSGAGSEYRERFEQTFPRWGTWCGKPAHDGDEAGGHEYSEDGCALCGHENHCRRPRVFDGECMECGAKGFPQ